MMGREPDTAPLPDDVALHLAECAACRDDAADPIGRLLAHVSHDFLAPPASFTQQVIARLPHASPQQLAQQTHQRRRLFTALSFVPVAVLVLALALGPVFQGLVQGSALGLLAATLRQVAAGARWPLLLMLGSAAVILASFGRVLQMPSTRGALGAALVAGALVIATASISVATDRANARAASTGTTVAATVASSIEVDAPVQGNVSSVWGDVSVDQPVSGTVASLFGNIAARAPVGSVLVGSGQFTGDSALAQVRIIAGLDKLGLASGVPGLGGGMWSQGSIRTGVAGVGMLLLLVLLGLTATLWPNPLAQASAALAAQPWLAIGLGTLLLSASALLLGPLVALLSWSVVGLLSLPLLFLFGHLPIIFGLAVMGGTLALRLFPRATTRQTLLANGAVLLVLLLLTLLVPPAGLLALYVVASVGFGALVLSARQTRSMDVAELV
jgi:hypothetical protein